MSCRCGSSPALLILPVALGTIIYTAWRLWFQLLLQQTYPHISNSKEDETSSRKYLQGRGRRDVKASKPSISLIQQKLSVCVQSSCRLLARVPRPTALTGLLCAVPIQPSPPQLPPLGGGPILGPEVSFRVPRFAPGFTPSPARPGPLQPPFTTCAAPRPAKGWQSDPAASPPRRPGPAASRRHVNGGRGGLGDAAQGQAEPCRAVPCLPARRSDTHHGAKNMTKCGAAAAPCRSISAL